MCRKKDICTDKREEEVRNNLVKGGGGVAVNVRMNMESILETSQEVHKREEIRIE
jgi:hypothetical protein